MGTPVPSRPLHSGTAAPKAEVLPRSAIIRRRVVFDTARAKGRRVSNRYMALNFIARDAIDANETGRVAFLTPKRVGSATVRNRLRRRMREIYRRTLATSAGEDFLIWIARPAALELPFDELKKCMAALMQRRD